MCPSLSRDQLYKIIGKRRQTLAVAACSTLIATSALIQHYYSHYLKQRQHNGMQNGESWMQELLNMEGRHEGIKNHIAVSTDTFKFLLKALSVKISFKSTY